MGDRNSSKAVLISGCSSGIGRATAVHLAQAPEDGLDVWAPTRKKEALEELEAAGCHAIELDVIVERDIQSAPR